MGLRLIPVGHRGHVVLPLKQSSMVNEKGQDYVILDQVRGRGKYVGTYLALTTLERYWYGEGEIKFYLDGGLHAMSD